MELSTMGGRYNDTGLSERDLANEPISQFQQWFDDWVATEPYDANAMIVATVDDDGWPSARAVLLKGLDERGFIFYTNRHSAKGRDIETSGRAALCFLWHPMERQVRVVGTVEHLPDSESDTYFASRPRDAQIGAWASPQSDVISSRAKLKHLVAQAKTRFTGGTDTSTSTADNASTIGNASTADNASTIGNANFLPVIPRPLHWGGYLVRPLSVEFWQGRRSRLHDRLRYRRSASQSTLLTDQSTWIVERLAP